jgi:hypothetical protein
MNSNRKGKQPMEYLIKRNGQRVTAHIWTGNDTLCTMASTGGLRLSRFEIHDSPNGRKICTMCANRANQPAKTKPSKYLPIETIDTEGLGK